MCGPLPLPLATSLAYAHPRTGGGDEADALASAPQGARHRGGRGQRSRRLRGRRRLPPARVRRPGHVRPAARRDGATGAESTRFGALSMALWADLLAHEEVRHDRAVRRLRPAARGHGRARGERRHGQDHDDRVAGRPVRRRGRRAPARAHARDVRPAGHLRAARTRPRAPRRRRARAARRHRRPDRPGRSRCSRAPTARREPSASTEALAEFDAATITTTHGFCQQMLTSLGTLGDVEPDARLVPDIASLEAEVVDDLYLRKYASSPKPTLTVKDARTIAHEAISDAAATLEPADAYRRQGRETPTASRPPPAASWCDASARCACSTTTTCCPAARRAHRPGDRAGRRGARPLAVPHRHGRRVPGHRPRAVGHPAHRVPRAPHARAHRRPEAGDLPVPRRRRRHLPARPRRRDDADPAPQLARRPGRARRPRPDPVRDRPRRRPHRRPPDRARAHGPTPARRSGRPAAAGDAHRRWACRATRRRPSARSATSSTPTSPPRCCAR